MQDSMNILIVYLFDGCYSIVDQSVPININMRVLIPCIMGISLAQLTNSRLYPCSEERLNKYFGLFLDQDTQKRMEDCHC